MDSLLSINASILEFIDISVFYFQQQEYDLGLQQLDKLINELEKILVNYESIIPLLNSHQESLEKDYLVQILEGISEAQFESDYILVSDLLILQLRPYFARLQELVMLEYNSLPSYARERNLQIVKSRDKKLYNYITKINEGSQSSNINIQCEFTSSGLATIKCNKDGCEFYLHSNNNPQLDAAVLANAWYADSKYKYIVYGFGLGYHIYQLCKRNCYIEIDVYESNLEVLQLAVAYGNIGECLESGQVRIFYDPDFENFSKRVSCFNDDTELVIHGPSQRLINNENIRERMEEYFLHYNSVRNQKGLLYGNYRYNICNYDASVDTLLTEWSNKDVYIVAAGPSLDLNYKYLKKIGNKGIILAIGAVFKKLMNNGITPDYIIITDGKPIVLEQIEGLYNEKVPLILLTTTSREVTAQYKGKKYLACQKEYDLAEEFAKDKGYMLYKTGGSVVTTAVDISISLQARRIIFVGLDLAYPNDSAYAEGIVERKLVDSKDIKWIKDIYGNFIKTNKHLNIYRQWIEKRIKGITSVEFIDATEGGAYIEGTICMKLEETIL